LIYHSSLSPDMNNKMVAGLLRGNTLIILGTAVGLLASVASPMLAIASDPCTGPSQEANPNQETIDHINNAQSALDNGDTEGAKRHLDLAKKSLGN
ncbi:MAG: hypothetical protein WA461_07975, partial [Nitrososphaeraceae archaeon]